MTLDYSAFDVNMKIVKMFTDDYGKDNKGLKFSCWHTWQKNLTLDSGYVRGAEI